MTSLVIPRSAPHRWYRSKWLPPARSQHQCLKELAGNFLYRIPCLEVILPGRTREAGLDKVSTPPTPASRLTRRCNEDCVRVDVSAERRRRRSSVCGRQDALSRRDYLTPEALGATWKKDGEKKGWIALERAGGLRKSRAHVLYRSVLRPGSSRPRARCPCLVSLFARPHLWLGLSPHRPRALDPHDRKSPL